MGPAEVTIRSKAGDEMYLVISYKRGGKFFKLKVPRYFSTYFARPFIYLQHSYGESRYNNQLNPYLNYFQP